SISSQIPWRMASTIVACPPRSGRADLCSFLTAVDIVRYSGYSSNFQLRIVRRLRMYQKSLSLWIYEHIESLHRISTQEDFRCGWHNNCAAHKYGPIFEPNLNRPHDIDFQKSFICEFH